MRQRLVRSICGLSLLGLLGGGLAAATQSKVGTRIRGFESPGDYPEGLCYDGTYLWSNNFTDGTLFQVDLGTGAVAHSFQGNGLPRQPEGLAWDGANIWTCDWQTGKIHKLRPEGDRLEILAVYDKPAGAGRTVGLTWDGDHLWLSTWYSDTYDKGQLWELDATDLHVLRRFDLPVYWVEDLAWDGRYIWSVDWLFRIGFAIDTTTGDTLNTYRTPGPHPVGQAWDGRYLWVSDTDSDSLYAIDISGIPTAVKSVAWSDVKQIFRGEPPTSERPDDTTDGAR